MHGTHIKIRLPCRENLQLLVQLHILCQYQLELTPIRIIEQYTGLMCSTLLERVHVCDTIAIPMEVNSWYLATSVHLMPGSDFKVANLCLYYIACNS